MILCPAHGYSWDGYDYDTDIDIEIENRYSVKLENDIEIYDYRDESYH